MPVLARRTFELQGAAEIGEEGARQRRGGAGAEHQHRLAEPVGAVRGRHAARKADKEGNGGNTVQQDDQRYAAAEFTEGHVEQVEVSGILKSSPHQDLARQFLAYMASTEGQKTLPTTNWMYPVIDLGADLPPAFGTQPAKVLPVDEATVTAQRNAWIEEALAAIR